MTIEISDGDLAQAAARYHHCMVDKDQYTVGQVRRALEAYLRHTACHFVENVTEFEFERPDELEKALQAETRAEKGKAV